MRVHGVSRPASGSAVLLLIASFLALVLLPAIGSDVAVAAAKGCWVKNQATGSTYDALQAAIDAAKPGATLLVRGTCRGSTLIGTDLTIEGQRTEERGKPILDGRRRDRVLRIRRGSSVTIRSLTVRNGRAPKDGPKRLRRLGGGIVNLGQLVLADVVVSKNRAAVGGGIWNEGTLRLTSDTKVRANRALAGGGISNARGTLYVEDDSVVIANRASSGGGGIDNDEGTVFIRDRSRVTGNLAKWTGAGIRMSAGTVTLEDTSSIDGNVAENGAAGAYVVGWGKKPGVLILRDRSMIERNQSGGVFLYWDCELHMSGDSTIRDNTGGTAVVSIDGVTTGVRCAPDPAANVYGNSPEDCDGVPEPSVLEASSETEPTAPPPALLAAAPGDVGRVELPRAGFAVTYPDGWRLETTGADGALMHLADQVWSDEFCRAFYATAPHTSEDTVQDTVAWVESNDFEMLARTDLSLPGGEAIRLDYDRVDYEVGDYYVDLDHGGVANLECYASTLPDDHWLAIAETIEAIPVETSSTEDEPPVSRFEFVPRVELPASGFAMDFPAEWEVLGSSDSPFDVDVARVVLEAWADDAYCRVLDSSALWGLLQTASSSRCTRQSSSASRVVPGGSSTPPTWRFRAGGPAVPSTRMSTGQSWRHTLTTR